MATAITGIFGAVLFLWVLYLIASSAGPAAMDAWGAYLEVVGAAMSLVSVLAAAALLVWLHRAVGNVSKLGLGQPLASPLMAVVWWFVPVAFLFMPFRVIRDLHRRLTPGDATLGGHLVEAWWAVWLTSWALFAVAWMLAPTVQDVPGAVLLAIAGLVYSLSIVAVCALSALVVRISMAGELGRSRRRLGD